MRGGRETEAETVVEVGDGGKLEAEVLEPGELVVLRVVETGEEGAVGVFVGMDFWGAGSRMRWIFGIEAGDIPEDDFILVVSLGDRFGEDHVIEEAHAVDVVRMEDGGDGVMVMDDMDDL